MEHAITTRNRESEPAPDAGSGLPRAWQSWPRAAEELAVGGPDPEEASEHDVRAYAADKPWVWTGETLYFFCDVHADAGAFFRSLVASGGVVAAPGEALAFELTERGRDATFLIGGDCFDKGPHNLRLLGVLRRLIDQGARVKILAGNHDIRTYVGLAYVGRKETHLAHLFVRMGKKTMRLVEEVWREYLEGKIDPSTLLPDDEVRRILFPPESWYEEFPRVAGRWINAKKLAKEITRIREKTADLEAFFQSQRMTFGMAYAAVQKCRELFLEPDGEFAWVFRDMVLAHRVGSVLFVHAGVDDVVADALRRDGVQSLNDWFRRLIAEDELFELYNGPVGNTVRTKYRDIDLPLTERGAASLRAAGVYAIVHGHKNILRGQRLVLRKGVLNFECDASIDANTRVLEGLSGPGAAVTVFRPDARILAVSTDYPYVKVFDPAELCPSVIIA